MKKAINFYANIFYNHFKKNDLFIYSLLTWITFYILFIGTITITNNIIISTIILLIFKLIIQKKPIINDIYHVKTKQHLIQIKNNWLKSSFITYGILWIINIYQKLLSPLVDKFPIYSNYIQYNADTAEFYTLLKKILQGSNSTDYVASINYLPSIFFCFIILPVFTFITFGITYKAAYERNNTKALKINMFFLLFSSILIFQRILDYTGHNWIHVDYYPISIVISQVATLYVFIYYLINCYKLYIANKSTQILNQNKSNKTYPTSTKAELLRKHSASL